MSVCIRTCCCSYSYQSMAADLALRTIDSELDAALLYSLDRDIYKKAKTSLDSSADKPHYHYEMMVDLLALASGIIE
jgi:hypothetical protein